MIVQRDPIEDKKIGINVLTGLLFVGMIVATIFGCNAIRKNYDQKFIDARAEIARKWPVDLSKLRNQYKKEHPQPVKSYEAF